MHYDKDEILYRISGEIFMPIFSSVYYPRTVNVGGGELELPGVRILPRTNRAVIFPGCLPHRVLAVTAGIRRSIAINGWSTPPLMWTSQRK
jgi:hypothetical protein